MNDLAKKAEPVAVYAPERDVFLLTAPLTSAWSRSTTLYRKNPSSMSHWKGKVTKLYLAPPEPSRERDARYIISALTAAGFVAEHRIFGDAVEYLEGILKGPEDE